MPSNQNPSASINAGEGPRVTGGGGSGGANAALIAHITDPSDAHPASAIGYAGGAAWADGTTNPAATVEAQLDKIITDLNSTAGSSGTHKIGGTAITETTVGIPGGSLRSQLERMIDADNLQFDAGLSEFADTTFIPDTSIQTAIDTLITNIAATVSPGGTTKLGSEQIVNASATIPAGTLFSQLVLLSRAANLHGNPGPAWHDGTANGSGTVQAKLDKIITDLVANPAGSGASGADRIGTAERSAWLGGRPNPGAVSVWDALDKVITDLAATAANDDGAERIGAAAQGDLATTSVRNQLNELDVNWGKLSRANTWTNTQTFNGSAGDTSAAIASSVLPTNRKLLAQYLVTDIPTNTYTRIYADKDFESFLITHNAGWNGTQWAADDTGAAAHEFRFDGGTVFGNFRISNKFTTSSAWATNGWDEYSTLSGRGLSLGNTTISGPASLVTSITLENPEILFLNTADATGTDSNPPATQGHINRLKAKNVPKMWANITTGGVTDLIQDGFNIASISSSGNTCVVNIQSDMVDADFACVAMCMSDQQTLIYSSTRTTGSVTLKAWNANTGTQVALGTTPIVISLILFGKQDS